MNDDSPGSGGTDVDDAPAGHRDGGIDTEHLRDYRALRRSSSDRKLAGVCAGLARHLDIDPTLVRVVIIVLTIFGGAGLLLYAVLWLFVPRDDRASATISMAESARNAVVIVTLLLALLIALPAGIDGFAVPLLVLAIIAIAILMSRDSTAESATRSSDLTSGSPGPDWAGTHSPPATAAAPSRRGPLLFGMALASLALALGLLGTFDVSGAADVPDGAYPALALAVVGAWLVVGSFYGRPGGLILLGLIALPALGFAQLVEPSFAGERDVTVRPVSAGELAQSYDVPAGRVEIDLTQVEDLDELDGRRITVDVRAGEILLIVPDEVSVDLDATVRAGGEIVTPDDLREGWDVALRELIDADEPQATIDADLEAGFGRIEVSNP